MPIHHQPFYTIRSPSSPRRPVRFPFTSLHPPFTTFCYHTVYYKEGEAVKAKKRKLFLEGFLLYLFNFGAKRTKFVAKRVKAYVRRYSEK
jgi:hypothetical protein